MRSFIAGWLLKLLAVASKLLFLAFALVSLTDGVYSTYFLYSTIAIGLSRFLSASGDEQIPIAIAQFKETENSAFVFALLFGLVTGLLFLTAAFSPPSILHGAALLTFSASFSAIVGGLVRVKKPLYYEVSANTPHAIFIVLFLFSGATSAEQIILLMAASHFSATSIVLAQYRSTINTNLSRESFASALSFARTLYINWRPWILKSLSNSATLLNLRYYAFLLFLTDRQQADELALALSAGEVLLQFVIIVVNRKFSSYLSGTISDAQVVADFFATWRKLWSFVAVSVFSILVIALLSRYYSLDLSAYKISLPLLAASSTGAIFFSTFSLYRVVHLYFETTPTQKRPVHYLFIQFSMLLCGSVGFLLLREELWIATLWGAVVNCTIPSCFMWTFCRK